MTGQMTGQPQVDRPKLARWLAQPAQGGPALEFEALVKVFLAEHGPKGDLLASLAGVRAWAQAGLPGLPARGEGGLTSICSARLSV